MNNQPWADQVGSRCPRLTPTFGGPALLVPVDPPNLIPTSGFHTPAMGVAVARVGTGAVRGISVGALLSYCDCCFSCIFCCFRELGWEIYRDDIALVTSLLVVDSSQ